ncbi:hypothetical protein [Candidatus Mycoplasma haematominutum]|uniref:hypothetical protein n=1 Tax=Candidatus Mycoplasma haematominutum TaxID=209446 RepID=UPI0002D8A1A9|nr:hypothetical protein [Candidatus Mycoplasma haematominutum]
MQKYISGREKVERFAQSLESKPRRSRRSVQAQEYPKLSQEERESLLEMYKLFEDLEKERNKLAPKFNELDQTSSINLETSNRPNRSELESKLRQLRWSTQSEIEYTTERAAPYGKPKIPNSWLDWSKNPYKLFLESSSEYTTLIDKMTKASQDRDRYLQRQLPWGFFSTLIGPGTVKSTYSAKNSFDSKVSAARADFSNKVALKLLVWMDQHKKPIYS